MNNDYHVSLDYCEFHLIYVGNKPHTLRDAVTDRNERHIILILIKLLKSSCRNTF